MPHGGRKAHTNPDDLDRKQCSSVPNGTRTDTGRAGEHGGGRPVNDRSDRRRQQNDEHLDLHAVAEALNVSYDALLRGSDVDARIGNIVAKLSGQTTDELAYLEQVIQTVIDYGARDRA